MDSLDTKQKKINKEYQDYANSISPKSNIVKNCIMAFWVGGLICTIGQLLNNIAKNYYNMSKEDASAFTSILLILASALLTGLGLYEKIGKRAGAGSIVPITGFANSIVAPAMEFKREGYVLGVGAKLFSIAGPVLVYGISASVIVGLIKYFFIK
ncbi:MAG TPA: stage V sporulation protein AC [Clostridia bacterium]|nr:stage V sporulation protein AC [Clostridia bacterium]